MYLKAILTLLLLVSAAIAIRLWRPAAIQPQDSISGEIAPYGIWPHDNVGVDRTLEKRIDHLVIDATRLDEALVQVRQKAGVNIIWNTQDLPVMSGEPIQRVFRNVTVEEALTDLLALGLRPPAVGTRDGVVIIRSNADVLRFYDVRGVLPKITHHQASTSAPTGGGLFPPMSDSEKALDGLIKMLSQALHDANVDHSPFDYGGLDWNGVLIVRASPRAHRVIIKHLETLRSAL